MMDIIALLNKEYAFETSVLRKFLALVPMDKLDYKPHPKSMSMKSLAVHLAELPGWAAIGFSTEELDFAASPYKPAEIITSTDLLNLMDENAKKGGASIANAKEADLLPNWTMRHGNQILAVYTKYEVVRHMLSQIAHHRAQLGVYFRLLDIPVPGTYGPSADDMSF